MSDDKITLSLPDTSPPPPRDKPHVRKMTIPKPVFNPLLEVDWDKISSKQEAFLIGYINGQNNRGDRR